MSNISAYNHADWQAKIEAANKVAGIDPAGGPGTDQGVRKAAIDAYEVAAGLVTGSLYADAVNGGRFGHPNAVYKILGDEVAPQGGLPDSAYTHWSVIGTGPTGWWYIAYKGGKQVAAIHCDPLADINELDAQYGI